MNSNTSIGIEDIEDQSFQFLISSRLQKLSLKVDYPASNADSPKSFKGRFLIQEEFTPQEKRGSINNFFNEYRKSENGECSETSWANIKNRLKSKKRKQRRSKKVDNQEQEESRHSTINQRIILNRIQKSHDKNMYLISNQSKAVRTDNMDSYDTLDTFFSSRNLLSHDKSTGNRTEQKNRLENLDQKNLLRIKSESRMAGLHPQGEPSAINRLKIIKIGLY